MIQNNIGKIISLIVVLAILGFAPDQVWDFMLGG